MQLNTKKMPTIKILSKQFRRTECRATLKIEAYNVLYAKVGTRYYKRSDAIATPLDL